MSSCYDMTEGQQRGPKIPNFRNTIKLSTENLYLSVLNNFIKRDSKVCLV